MGTTSYSAERIASLDSRSWELAEAMLTTNRRLLSSVGSTS